MDPVSNVARSIEAVNGILETAQKASMETAEKMIEVQTAMALGTEAGKGELVDITA